MYDIFYLDEPLDDFPRARHVNTIEEAQELSRTRYCWILNNNNDYSNFDFLYEPKPWESDHVHVWPSQFHENGGTHLIPKTKSDGFNYNHPVINRIKSNDIVYVDYSNEGSEEQFQALVRKGYNVTKKRTIDSFYDTVQRIIKQSTKQIWIVNSLNDNTTFDFLWHKGQWDPNMNVWGTQHQDDSGIYKVDLTTHAIKYHPETVERKFTPKVLYIDYGNNIDDQLYLLEESGLDVTVKRFYKSLNETVDRIKKNITEPTWVISSLNDYTDFDFTWHPNHFNESNIQLFPSQHQPHGGTYLISSPDVNIESMNSRTVMRIKSAPIYYIDYGNETTLVDELQANGFKVHKTRFYGTLGDTLVRIHDKISQPSWVISSLNDYTDFDFTWHPNKWQEVNIHKWASQYQKNGGTYYLPVKTGNVPEVKYNSSIIMRKVNPYPIIMIDYNNKDALPFDYEHTTTRYADSLKSTLKRIQDKITEPTWVVSSLNMNNHFDFNWHPAETQLETIHIWPSQHQRESGTFFLQPGPANDTVYEKEIVTRVSRCPIVYIDYDNCTDQFEKLEAQGLDITRTRFVNNLHDTGRRIRKKLTETSWIISSLNNYDGFDFTWHPALSDENYVHTWPSQHQQQGGTFLFRYGANVEKLQDVIVPRTYVPPIEFIDYGNDKADTKFRVIQLANQNAHRARFVNSEWETLKRIHTNCLVPKWVVNSLSDYSDFDFTWHPNEFETDVIQAYPTQHQKSGGAYLLPKFEYGKAFNTNFKKHIVPRTEKADTIWIDFGNNLGRVVPISDTGKIDYQTRFINDYLGTLQRAFRSYSANNVWVISSVCDYKKFDFTWHPDISQDKMLHVFPSGDQKYGDTFYINVQEFLKQAEKINKLEWFEINLIKDKRVFRYPLQEIKHDYNSQVDAVKAINFDGPLALYSSSAESCLETLTVSLWRPETRTIVPLNRGGSCVIVPKDALNEIQHQLYDYKYIDKNYRDQPELPIDIVFLDNGEGKAQEHYEWLLECTKDKDVQVHRVSNVEGRVQSMQAAARCSNTDWFFVVNAKLKVDKDFDWSWQPDRLQEKKNYIFYADNPYTGDRYGHMAVVAYNALLVRTPVNYGLDFAMSFETAVIPVLSGEAEYADTPWDAWRTAFRETLKLITALNDDGVTDVNTEQRIYKWLGATEEWNKKGANDAKQFYDDVDGNLEEIQKSFEWKWLNDMFAKLHS